jgi:hypothetical protein
MAMSLLCTESTSLAFSDPAAAWGGECNESGNLCRERISSGVLTLDCILGGGIPLGRIVEIYGPESSGKTSLGLCIMAEAQKKNRAVALIDAEHAFDKHHAQNIGLDLSEDRFCMSAPDTGEDAFEVCFIWVLSGCCELQTFYSPLPEHFSSPEAMQLCRGNYQMYRASLDLLAGVTRRGVVRALLATQRCGSR